MSLSDEERSIVVELEIEKAYVAYKETIWLMEKSSWSGAASALLIHDCHQVNSHKGSHILFGNYYIKTEILPKEYATIYSQMEAIREEGEYNCTYKVTENELQQRLPRAKEMIDTIAAMVKG